VKFLLQIFGYLLLFQYAIAQPGKEAWHWQFGNKCALDFSSGTPVAGFSAISTLEGSSSVSDANTGQLLFYTDGVKVYDRNDNQMPNGYGLLGSFSSPQSAIIIPWPGHSGFYYIISVDQNDYVNPNQGVHYSIVDMSQNGGLGDISLKNVQLTVPKTIESCIAIKHCNNVDYWIITHYADSDIFNSYLLNAAGINPTPVITHIGDIQQSAVVSTEFKVSPDGNKIISGSGSVLGVTLYDFNRMDGHLSNAITIALETEPYALSFSSNNTKVYATLPGSMKVFQLDLTIYNQSAINASKTLVASGQQYYGMQLAPNGKIYLTHDSVNSLAVINNPNNSGAGCNFQEYGVSLINGSATELGLPTFIDMGYDFFSSDTLRYVFSYDTSMCMGENVELTGYPNFPNWTWSTGLNAPFITINDSGSYTATYNATSTCISIDNFHASFKPQPKVNLGNDTMFYCTGSTFLRAFNPNSTYLWNTGETAGGIIVSLPGTYWVQVNEDGCKTSDTIKILTDTSKHNVAFPNIVTPNGDGINDYINFSAKFVTVLHVEVFNRWGKKIFECDNSNPIWYPDQTNTDDGTYYYIGEYEIDCMKSATNRSIKGFITVIR
jgi:gliding motility-associated-like protein